MIAQKNKTLGGLVLALAIMLMIILSACGSSTSASTSGLSTQTQTTNLDQLAAVARKEGTLTFYETPGESKIQQWVKPFETKYGVTIKLYRAPSSSIFRRFSQEEQAGRHIADVVAMSLPEDFNKSIDSGWAAKYIPQSRSKISNEWVIKDTVYPMYLTTQVIMWNSDRVSPQDQQDIRQHGLRALLNPKWKGQIAITTAEAGGGQLGGYYKIIQDPGYGWGFLKQLAAQEPKVYKSSITMGTDMVAGEFALGFGGSDTVAWPEISKGAPIGFSYYDDTVSSEQAMFVSSHAPHPAAARLFMEWGTSLAAEEKLADISGGLISHSDWQDKRAIRKKDWYAPPKKLDYAWASDPQFNKNADNIVRQWVSVFGQS